MADRLFSSIPRAWRANAADPGSGEVKELTPEWYALPDFLRNVNGLALGTTQAGER